MIPLMKIYLMFQKPDPLYLLKCPKIPETEFILASKFVLNENCYIYIYIYITVFFCFPFIYIYIYIYIYI